MPRLLPARAFLLFALVACGDVSSHSVPDAPDKPDAPGTMGGCATGDSCQIDDQPGLCAANKCGECADTTDDAKCAAAYGAGTLCVSGACIAATCHDSGDCGGKQCIDNKCVGCTDDTDCDSGEVCNASGSCVAAGNVCSGHPISSSCGNHDLCCNVGASESCIAAECCVNADCTSQTGAGSTCQGGTCVPSSSACVAPTSPTYYVDPSYSGPSTGSSACPFKTLHGAFNAVRNDAFTGDSEVIIKGGTINATSEGGAMYFPLTLPSSVYLRTASSATTPAVIVAPANTTAFEAPYGAQAAATSTWAARISNLEIKQASAGTGGTAIHVTGGSMAKPVHIDHLEIHNFYHGMNVESGWAEIDWGMNSHDNASSGLYVGGGHVVMDVGATADARSHYDHNNYGIYVTSDATSLLQIAAAEPTSGTFMGLKMVTASNNAKNGLHIASPNAGNSLLNVGVQSNGGSGVALFGGAKVSLRKLRIQSSGADGINIIDNGSAISLSGIDLGKSGDMGRNEITDSTGSHICIQTTYDASQLLALGNTFGTGDCSLASPGVSVRSFATCAGHGGGVNDNVANQLVPRFHVDNCPVSFQ